MKKKRFTEKYYSFIVSFVLVFSFLFVGLSMFVSYANTQEQAFGEIARPIDIYQRVDGAFVFTAGKKSYVFLK